MTTITKTSDLTAFCEAAALHDYVTVDTEFLREHTYYAKLCVVQVAFEGEGGENSAVIDVLAEGIDLAPLMTLFRNPNVVKVFHAARQDLEIFHHDFGVLPTPFFDTQIAAMVAGFGDQVGYETLVKAICKGKVDKSSRFTDWSRRPLSEAQINYARSDVTYLRDIYTKLKAKLEKEGRLTWVEEELGQMVDPKLYEVNPREFWRKIRARSHSPKFLNVVRELAAFREEFAIAKNVPRNRVFKDDALLEIAAQRPSKPEELRKLRLWPKDQYKGPLVEGIMEALNRAALTDPADYPQANDPADNERADGSLIDLLKVYLKAQSERHNVATKLICTSSELEAFAFDPEGEHALNSGWRYQLFGKTAKELLAGNLALRPNGKYVEAVKFVAEKSA